MTSRRYRRHGSASTQKFSDAANGRDRPTNLPVHLSDWRQMLTRPAATGMLLEDLMTVANGDAAALQAFVVNKGVI